MPTIFRDLRASADTRYVGASLEEGSITIWETDKPVSIATVQPGFEGGTSRYAIDPVNGHIFSGTWDNGLTCFNYRTGKVVWKRRDLLGIQDVSFSGAFPSSVFVVVEPDDHTSLRWQLLHLLSMGKGKVVSGIAELDSRTGRTVWARQGSEVFLLPTKPIMVIHDRYRLRILDARKNEIGSAPMANFAIFDVGFSNDMISLAEGVKGVRVLNLEGDVLSHYMPPDRRPSCSRIAFDGNRLCVFDSWDDSFVTILEPLAGVVVAEYRRPIHGEICFIDHGSRYVDSFGRVCKSADGEVVAQLKA